MKLKKEEKKTKEINAAGLAACGSKKKTGAKTFLILFYFRSSTVYRNMLICDVRFSVCVLYG